ncbi:MAG: hypothetical protein UW88_C0011G0063 [Candidatus Collierbacteria bacterium GW2011_GWD2_45_10]|uniref:Uncharacterized protein n=1 Tax=Candidatus Collierbacteria bacterium GW2011_GWB2_44_22 TaxID=1618387 RepID=A0A0G1HXI6_9BACT|nr:MAG: hypothetical protein UW31_C0006G0052 [Candidatus Collierbacteria bacterium GW2011_GWA2_44_13]KKT51333.1 MAG: hypothetical protein UW44_C0013G0053 [Candidatus Collierbacteria bacterium GW2011_GWB2_44_22]KKT66543.1 MAG: hypothetical protein UW58_C0006G0006 [Candidatus Collierbacteria bacterium GW2011_GWC2_44_30]KKT88423.1 MAG: hypothetical protein UW88_C0011G0063 [Candidatus Collierbacteria bacterium GW2011_GWD2_45_10]
MEESPSGLWRLLGKQVCFGIRGSESRLLRQKQIWLQKVNNLTLPLTLGVDVDMIR